MNKINTYFKNNKIIKNAKGRFNPNIFIALILCFFLLIVAEYFSGFISSLLSFRDISSITRFVIYVLTIPFASIIIVVFLWVKIVESRQVTSIGFTLKGFAKKYIRGFVIGFVLILLCTIILILMGAIKADVDNYSVKTSAFSSVFIVLIGWLIQGASEEVLVRGWLFAKIAYRHNYLLAIIASASFFAFLHLGNNHISFIPMLNLILYGVFAAVYVLYEESLWGICAIHSAWNWAQGNVVGFEVSGNQAVGGSLLNFNNVTGYDLLTGGSFGLEGGLICTLVLTAATIITIFLVKKKADCTLTT